MVNIEHKYLSLFFVFLLLLGDGECGELILFLNCDTQASKLENSVFNDLQNIRDEALRISHYTGMQIQEIIFDGSDLEPKSVFKSLKKLKVNSDDVILYFFSGHGYRTPSRGENPWPYLYFSKYDHGVDYEKILEILSNKHPKLLLALADCCNNILEERYAPPVYKLSGSKKNEEKIANAYKKLFLETEGEILITSSEIGEFSWCIPKGALFTTAFIDEIRLETGWSDASWERIILRASYRVKKYQKPFYLISPP